MRWIKWIAGLTSVAAVLFACGFLVFVNVIQTPPQAIFRKTDGIVVLTGGKERIAVGLRLLANKSGGRLLISGVNKRTTRRALVNLIPHQAHLFQCCVDIGYEARDTIGNATETQQWVRDNKFKSLIVVTSSYHMPRSLAEMHRALPDTTLYSNPVFSRSIATGSWYSNPGTARLLLWEYIKFLPAATRYYVARTFATGSSTHAIHADTATAS